MYEYLQLGALDVRVDGPMYVEVMTVATVASSLCFHLLFISFNFSTLCLLKQPKCDLNRKSIRATDRICIFFLLIKSMV